MSLLDRAKDLLFEARLPHAKAKWPPYQRPYPLFFLRGRLLGYP
jgi:hypothetical protein